MMRAQFSNPENKARPAAWVVGILIAIVATAGFFYASQTQSSESEHDASAFVTGLIYAGMKIVDDPALDPAERDRRFTELLARNVDTPRIARFVLGRYWNSASDRERKEFVGVYPPYLAKAFAGRLGQFAGAIVSVSSTKRLDDDIRIKTNIHFVGPRPSSASTSEWEIGWLVRSTPDGFKIEDVDIQGASLRLHERTNLMTLIATAGETVAGLIKVIRGSLGGSGRS